MLEENKNLEELEKYKAKAEKYEKRYKIYKEVCEVRDGKNLKDMNFKNYIIIALIVFSFLSNVVVSGIFIYKELKILESFEIEMTDEVTTTYEQQADGSSSIVNGNQYKDNALHQEQKSDK